MTTDTIPKEAAVEVNQRMPNQRLQKYRHTTGLQDPAQLRHCAFAVEVQQHGVADYSVEGVVGKG